MPPSKSKRPKAEPKQLVLAKMLGWPAWPSFVMPTKLIPPGVLKAKKKLTEYCVIFIPDGDFYWMNEKSIEELSADKLAKRLEKIEGAGNTGKKGKKSASGSGRTLNVNDALTAAHGLKFENFMRQLKERNGDDDDEDGDEEDEEEDVEGVEAQNEQEVDAKADLPNIKNEDNEDEEEEDDDFINKKAGGRKRTRGVKEEDDTGEKILNGRSKGRPSRKRSRSPIIKEEEYPSATSNEEDDSQPENRKIQKRSTPLSRGASPITSKAGASKKGTNGSLKNGSNDREQLDERQHQLWLCRIKLQRSLIQRNQANTPTNPRDFPPPSADELSVARLILHKLADIPVTTDLLKVTKIHKVLKCILKDEDLEYPDSFKLHEKCQELLTKWLDVIEKIRLEKVQAATNAGGNQNNATEVASDSASGSVSVTGTATEVLQPEGDDSEVSTIANGTEDDRKD